MRVILYGRDDFLDEITAYLKEKTSLPVYREPAFWDIHHDNELFHKLASIRVSDPFHPDKLNDGPHSIEVNFERERLREGKKIKGLVYEGLHLLELYGDYLPAEKRALSYCHVIITEELFSTYFDGRHHLRTALFAFPNLISTSGVVEAPARSPGYYIHKQMNPHAEAGEDFLDYGDSRIKDAVKMLALKAVLYHLGKDIECFDKRCHLFDAHTQGDLIAQIHYTDEFCERHTQMLKQVKNEA